MELGSISVLENLILNLNTKKLIAFQSNQSNLEFQQNWIYILINHKPIKMVNCSVFVFLFWCIIIWI